MQSNKTFSPELIQDFHSLIEQYSNHRYKSWEHCYIAFQEVKDVNVLSLHLGFYLASWGMYRGSSGLLQKDYTVHNGAVEIILKDKFKAIHFTRENPFKIKEKEAIIKLVLELRKELSKYYSGIEFTKGNKAPKPIAATDTLITKIMLGTLGCIPAYDRYFKVGFKDSGLLGVGVSTKSLDSLFSFITKNEELIGIAQQELLEKGTFYPIMKIVDMYFFNLGMELEKEIK